MEDAPSGETSPTIDLSDQIALEGLVDVLFASADAKAFEAMNQIRSRITGAN